MEIPPFDLDRLSGERLLKQKPVLISLYNGSLNQEIYKIHKMLKHGHAFLTKKGCKALKSYSIARYKIQGAALLREDYFKIMI